MAGWPASGVLELLDYGALVRSAWLGPVARRLAWMLAGALLPGCGYERVTGDAMGTTYTVLGDCALPAARLDAALRQVNRQMSTYDPDSELSTFNRASVGETVHVSVALAEVATAAQALAERTGGAFDATVAPLVALWGFGAQAQERAPTAAQVDAARSRVGYRKVRVEAAPPRLVKQAAATLDLSGIAKGYAVDQLAELLRASNCADFLVELGGEVRTAGAAPGGGHWQVAVESPDGGQLATLRLRDGAVATSGDYRQRRVVDGKRVSHIIDPRTGHPVRHQTASVTVVAATAMEADGLATALLVLGAREGLAFAVRHDVAALFVVRQDDGFAIRETPSLADYR